MRVPLSWLKEFVEIDDNPEELAKKLTYAGICVENIHYLDTGISEVVVGKIVELKQHPSADRLRIAKVDAGKETLLQVITAAENVREAHFVPVALVGANLATGMIIKHSKLRGEPSEGMMCSAKELGIDSSLLPLEEREGVLILKGEPSPGTEIKSLFGLDDVVLELELPANRPDLLSIWGIAYEVSAIYNKRVNMPEMSIKKEENIGSYEVVIENKSLSSGYIARCYENVLIAPSPQWMKNRLEAAGIRSINNVVDITNYVLLETGEPLHAFDIDKITSNKIFVRNAKQGESIKCIDDAERKLDESVLIISDSKGPIAIAGVMGGKDTEVSDLTKGILLEAAHFNQATVRRTSLKMGLRSESSRRFEKGVSKYQVPVASKRADYLLQKIAGAKPSGYYYAGELFEETTNNVIFRPIRVNMFLGTNIQEQKMLDILSCLNFKFEKDTACEKLFCVSVPSYRQDIKLEEDLIEEIARIWGYDNIKPTLPIGSTCFGRSARIKNDEFIIKQLLSKLGLNEIQTLTLLNPQKTFNKGTAQEKFIEIINPLSEDQGVLRASMHHHFMEVVLNNLKMKNNDLGLFEIANVYLNNISGCCEEKRLAMVITGSFGNKKADFFTIKGILAKLFDFLNIKFELCRFEKNDDSYFHPGKSAEILVDGKNIGAFGSIHPEVLEFYGFENDILFTELNIEEILKNNKEKRFNPLPKYPEILRDIAVIVPESMPSAEVENILKENAGDFLINIYCFDQYKGDQIPEGNKSLAYSLTFLSNEGTLTDIEINSIMEKIGKKIETLPDMCIRC